MTTLGMDVCFDVSGVQEYLISRMKHWGQRLSLVVVPHYVLLCLPNYSLGFLNCCLYLLCELVHYF